MTALEPTRFFTFSRYLVISKPIDLDPKSFCFPKARGFHFERVLDDHLSRLINLDGAYLSDDLEYRAQDYFDMGDFQDVDRHNEDSEVENDAQENTDTSALEYRNGKDIQGIQWEELNHSREKYREIRLKQYRNYESLPRSENELECRTVNRGHTFYDFQFNTRLVKSTIVHFQLRNLIWATSKHDVYMVQSYSVLHWSSLQRNAREVFNVAGQVVPTMDCHIPAAHPLSRVRICTMAVRDNLVVAGGFEGEFICKHLNRPGVSFCAKLTPDDNAITNAVDIYRTSTGSLRVSAANNDCKVIIFDTENFTQLSCLSFSWPVNNTSVSPDGKLLAVLGDSTECLLADAQSGKNQRNTSKTAQVVGSLKGHLDYSFASAWHPDGNILATGNQDRTCRLWDVRNLSGSLAVLKGRMGSIRGIKFSADGRFMAMAEPADFIHIFDVKPDYSRSQVINLFGEIAGISFSPDSEAIFVGIADRTYGSLMEFRRRHPYQYLDSLL